MKTIKKEKGIKIKTKKKLTKKQIVLRAIACSLAVILLAGSSVALYYYKKISDIDRTDIDVVDDPIVIDIDDMPDITDEDELPDEMVTDKDKDTITGTGGVRWGTGRVRVYVKDGFPIKKVAQKDPYIKNILVFGVDARSVKEVVCRADALIIMSIDSRTNSIKLTSIMRDTQMKIPGRTKKDKVTHAYAYGGVGLLINTINENLNLDIQDFVMFDFMSAQEVIDKVGGIEVNITNSELKYINMYIKHLNTLMEKTKPAPYIEKTGKQTLTGRQAVAYARIRYTGGDQGRTQRQRVIMDGLLSQFLNANTTTKITAINSLLGMFETNMTNTEIINLGLSSMAKIGTVLQYRIPEDKYAKESTVGSWQWIVDWDKQLPALFDFIYKGKVQPVVPSYNQGNEPKTEPVTQPVTEPKTQPVTEPKTQPSTEPVTQPVTEPKTEPLTEPITEVSTVQ